MQDNPRHAGRRLARGGLNGRRGLDDAGTAVAVSGRRSHEDRRPL